VVLIAVMVDRRAVTFRTLAVAAMSDNTPQAPCDLSSKGGLLLLRVSSRP
jgi:hypothetical protein